MRTHNEIFMRAHPDRCFEGAAEVERWPEILPHYRRVAFVRRDGDATGRVLMKAYRHFGPLPWPISWESEMEADPERRIVRYHHVGGITTGMDVEWRVMPEEGGARVVIVHEWGGPPWPLIGRWAARHVIGPRFVHVVAQRTLEGVRRAAEADA